MTVHAQQLQHPMNDQNVQATLRPCPRRVKGKAMSTRKPAPFLGAVRAGAIVGSSGKRCRLRSDGGRTSVWIAPKLVALVHNQRRHAATRDRTTYEYLVIT